MRTLLQGDGWPKGGLKGGLLPTKKNANQRKPLTRISLLQSGRRDLTRPAASAAGAGLSPASGAKAPQAPKLNPRPPDAEPARSAGGADVVGWGSAGASTPCESLEGRVTTSSSDHAMFWASVS